MVTTFWEYFEFFKSVGNSEILSLYKAFLARRGEKVFISPNLLKQ